MQYCTLVYFAAVVQVWDRNKPWLMDFINIPVDYAIEPSRPRLVLGGIVCLQTPISANRGKGDN